MTLLKKYAYHKPTPETAEKIQKARELFSDFEKALTEICPDSCEFSVCKTQLELAATMATKSIIVNDPASEVVY